MCAQIKNKQPSKNPPNQPNYQTKSNQLAGTLGQIMLLYRKTGDNGRAAHLDKQKVSWSTRRNQSGNQNNRGIWKAAFGDKIRKIKDQWEVTWDIKGHSRGFYRHMYPKGERSWEEFKSVNAWGRQISGGWKGKDLRTQYLLRHSFIRQILLLDLCTFQRVLRRARRSSHGHQQYKGYLENIYVCMYLDPWHRMEFTQEYCKKSWLMQLWSICHTGVLGKWLRTREGYKLIWLWGEQK